MDFACRSDIVFVYAVKNAAFYAKFVIMPMCLVGLYLLQFFPNINSQGLFHHLGIKIPQNVLIDLGYRGFNAVNLAETSINRHCGLDPQSPKYSFDSGDPESSSG